MSVLIVEVLVIFFIVSGFAFLVWQHLQYRKLNKWILDGRKRDQEFQKQLEEHDKKFFEELQGLMKKEQERKNQNDIN